LIATPTRKHRKPWRTYWQQNELTSVNKLKAFIAPPVDRVAKLLEAISKLEEDELESFKTAFDEMLGAGAE
jgi:hypothetical protein